MRDPGPVRRAAEPESRVVDDDVEELDDEEDDEDDEENYDDYDADAAGSPYKLREPGDSKDDDEPELTANSALIREATTGKGPGIEHMGLPAPLAPVTPIRTKGKAHAAVSPPQQRRIELSVRLQETPVRVPCASVRMHRGAQHAVPTPVFLSLLSRLAVSPRGRTHRRPRAD